MPEWLKGALQALRPRLGRLFNSQDPSMEVNLAGYAYGVLAASALLGVWVYLGPRDGALALAFGAFCTAFTTGLWKKGSNAPAPPETKGTQDQEGGKS